MRHRLSLAQNAHYRWSLLLLILTGTGLRFFRLDGQSLWFDEAARLAQATSMLSNILQNVGQDTQPPLHHLTQHFWLLLGVNDYMVRFLPALNGILLIAVVYRLGRDIFGPKTAIIAAALTAIMPYQVYQSQQANLYALLVLMSALQILLFHRALHSNRWFYWLLFALGTLLGLYTQYLAGFTVAALHLTLLRYHRRYPDRWQRLLVVDVIVGLGFLPQINNLLNGINIISDNFWLTKPTFLAPLVTLHVFTASYSLPGWVAAAALFVTLGIVILGIYELFMATRKGQQSREPLIFLAILVVVPIALAFTISQIRPIYVDRALIVIAPAFILLLAQALASSHLRSPLPYLYGLLALVIAVSLFSYYTNPTFAKPPYREATRYLNSVYQPEQAIVHTGNGSYLPALFYDPPMEHYLLQGDPAPHQPGGIFRLKGGRDITLDQLAQFEQVWLVVALDHSIDYQREMVTYFDGQYRLLAETDIGGILLRQYDLTQPPATAAQNSEHP